MNRNTCLRRLLTSASALTPGIVLLAQPTSAQTVPQQAGSTDAQQAARQNGFDEIIVTAQRRAENKQTVPVSISAFSSEKLSDQGITNVSELQKLTPGILLNGAGSISHATFTIRGQGKAVVGPGLPSVITYVNEVPLGTIGSSPPTFDLGNIQILKGPQGTAFGRNTTGGAILAYTVAPSYELEGYFQAQYGNYNDRQLQGAVNVPIVDDMLSIRIAGEIARRKGFTKNFSTGKRMDDLHSDAIRASVLFEPTDRIKNTLVADYIKYDMEGPALFPFGPVLNPALIPAINAQAALGKRAVNTSIDPSYHNVHWGISNTTTIDLGAVTVKNIVGFIHDTSNEVFDAAGVPRGAPLPDLGAAITDPIQRAGFYLLFPPGAPSIVATNIGYSRNQQFTEELQLSGTLFDDKLDWLLGGFYLNKTPDGRNALAFDIFHPINPTPTQIYVASLAGGASPLSAVADQFYSDKSKSVFGNFTYDLSGISPALEGLKFNGGYRYTWDEQGVCSNSRNIFSYADSSLLAPITPDLDACKAVVGTYVAKAKFKAPTYTVGLNYAVNDDIFLYVTRRTGYRAGGLNGPNLQTALKPYQTFDPQKVTDHEVGAHVKWNSGGVRGQFNIAGFYDKYRKLQLQATGLRTGSLLGDGVTRVTVQPSGTSLALNAGNATFKGFELDGSLGYGGLTVTYGVSYITAKYTSFTVPTLLNPFFSAANFTGVPKWSYQASAEYVLPFKPGIGGEIALRGNFYHIDKQYQGFALMPSTELTDLAVDWKKVGNRNLNITAYVNNLFDRRYIQNVALSQPAFGNFSGALGAPRQYGIRVRYEFGN